MRFVRRWSRAAPSSSSTRSCGRTVTTRAPTPATSRGSKTAPSSARTRRRRRGPPTTGIEPFKMRHKLKELFSGSMRGRTMYVLAFSMGPVGSPMSQIGVQLTDSPYVVASMRIMARIGLPVFAEIDKGEKRVVPCMHTVGARLRRPARRALALQPREVHRPLPRDTRDLVVRLRLRRQRTAGQEVLRAADRLEHRARRGLDGRAHVDPRGRRPARREDVCHRRVSLGLRQDELLPC